MSTSQKGDEGTYTRNFNQIQFCKQREAWYDSYYNELESLEKIGKFKVVVRPTDEQVLQLVELFDIEFDPFKQKMKFKTRFAVRGDQELEGSYSTYAPVVDKLLIRLVLALVGILGFFSGQIDISTAFLYGDRKRKTYIVLPRGHKSRGEGDLVWVTECSIYGLRDSPRRWDKKINRKFRKYGLKPFILDQCLYRCPEKNLIVILYVDDIYYFAESKQVLKEFETYLDSFFNIKKTYKVKKYVGHEIDRIGDDKVFVHCKQYIKEALIKYDMLKCKPCRNPCIKGFQDTIIDTEELNDNQQFQSLLGTLSYISNLCRPDISYVTNYLARQCNKPKKAHLKLARRVFRYLKYSSNKGL